MSTRLPLHHRFRAGHLLAMVHTLKKLHLEIREERLTDQVLARYPYCFGSLEENWKIHINQLSTCDKLFQCSVRNVQVDINSFFIEMVEGSRYRYMLVTGIT